MQRRKHGPMPPFFMQHGNTPAQLPLWAELAEAEGGKAEAGAEAEVEAEAEAGAEAEAERLERYIAWVERMWEVERPLTASERALASEIATWALAHGYWNLNLDAEWLAAQSPNRRPDAL